MSEPINSELLCTHLKHICEVAGTTICAENTSLRARCEAAEKDGCVLVPLKVSDTLAAHLVRCHIANLDGNKRYAAQNKWDALLAAARPNAKEE